MTARNVLRFLLAACALAMGARGIGCTSSMDGNDGATHFLQCHSSSDCAQGEQCNAKGECVPLTLGSADAAVRTDGAAPPDGPSAEHASFSSAWSKRIGQGGVLGITYDPAGDLVVAGEIIGPFDPELGIPAEPIDAAIPPRDGFVCKLDSTGAPIWTRRWLSATGSIAGAVATDSTGDVLVSGESPGVFDVGSGPLSPPAGQDYSNVLVKYDLQGNVLWTRPIVAQRIVLDRDDNMFVLEAASFGVYPASLVKLDAQGNDVWSKGIENNLNWVDLAANPSGQVATFVQGTTPQTATIATWDSDGNPLWSTELVSDLSLAVGPIAIDASGNVVVAGTFYGLLDVGAASPLSSASTGAVAAFIFVAEYDATGAHVWSHAFGDGGRGLKRPSDIALGATGNVALTGAFAGAIDFGLGPLTTTAVGDRDVFVALFDGTGHALASEQFGDRALVSCPRSPFHNASSPCPSSVA